MKISESIGLRAKGIVEITLKDKNTGEVTEVITSNNLIVKIGRTEMIKLLAGTSLKRITQMAIGSGGADIANSPFVPIPPLDGNIGLSSQKKMQAIASVVTDFTKTNPKVTFTTTFDCDQVNSPVNEIGLFFDDISTMFSRYTFKTVPLFAGDNIMMEVSWLIEF